MRICNKDDVENKWVPCLVYKLIMLVEDHRYILSTTMWCKKTNYVHYYNLISTQMRYDSSTIPSSSHFEVHYVGNTKKRTCSCLSSQNPSRWTRWRWCNRLRSISSLRNSFIPWKLTSEALFIATCLLSRCAMYTFPKPPSPISQSLLNDFVALIISLYVYLLTPGGTSQWPLSSSI